MSNWKLCHVDVPDQTMHRVPEQFDALHALGKDGWEPFSVQNVSASEGPGGVAVPAIRMWFKKSA